MGKGAPGCAKSVSVLWVCCWLLAGGLVLVPLAIEETARGATPGTQEVVARQVAPAAVGTPLAQRYTATNSRNLGRSIAVSADGQTMVVGAYDGANNNAGPGRAFVFQRTGAIWEQIAELAHTPSQNNDWFGVSVAIDGDTIVVGAGRYASNAGAAFVYTRPNATSTNWTQLQYLPAPASSTFGFSVSIQGDWIAVGARFDDHGGDSGNDHGAVYLYRRTGPVSAPWVQTTTVKADVTPVNHYFGEGVDLDNNVLAVRAFAGSSTNAIYSYRNTSGNTWVPLTPVAITLGGGDASSVANYDLPIALRGNLLVTGAYLTDNNGVDAGVAYLYQLNPTNSYQWDLVQTLFADDTTTNDFFGMAVDVTDNAIVVGAPGAESANKLGAVYLFTPRNQADPTATPWVLRSKLVVPAATAEIGDKLGRAVAWQANVIAIGAPDLTATPGAVYVYDAALLTATPTNTPVPPTPTNTPTPPPGSTPPSPTPTPTDTGIGDPTQQVRQSVYLALVQRVDALPTPADTPTTVPPQWQAIGQLPDPQNKLISTVLAVLGDKLFIGARDDNKQGGLYSRNLGDCTGSSITRVTIDKDNKARTILGISLHGSGTGVVAAFGERTFYTADSGQTWTQTTSTIGGKPSSVETTDGQTFYTGTDENGVYSSTDGGKTWQSLAKSKAKINRLRLHDNTLWLGVGNDGVWAGTNNPEPRNTGLPGGLEVWDFAFHPTSNTIYLATSAGVFSGDGNAAWLAFSDGLPSLTVRSLEIVGQFLYAGAATPQGVWQRPINGSSQWQQISPVDWVVRDLLYENAICGGLLAATDDGVWLYK